MARTYVSWSCGHDEVRQLYGPNKDRDRYVEWAESKGLCPDCYKAAMREAERKAGPQFLVRRIWPGDGAPGVEVVCHSGSYDVKDELKERGWRFGREVATAADGDLLKPGRPGWYVRFSKGEGEAAKSELEWVEENGWPVEAVGAVTSAFDAVGLGRRDLIPPLGPPEGGEA